MIYLEDVLFIHESLVLIGECMDGIRDYNLLQSAVAGQQWYQNVFDMYVHVAYSINASHLFNDLNNFGYFFDDNSLAKEVLSLARHTVSEQEFRARVCNCII